MNNQGNNRLAAVEAILADFGLGMQELRKAQAEVAKSQAETDLLIKQSSADFDRRMQQSRADFDRRSEAFDRQLQQSRADFDRRSDAFDRQLQKSIADFDRRSEAFDRQLQKSSADYDRRMINFEKTMGSWSNNHGSFAEEYFFNSFENGLQNFFGEKFDDIKKRVPSMHHDFPDEYDIVLTNGKSVCIIEVKFKAHQDHIAKVLNKAVTFRGNFPYYANNQVYLGYASLAFDTHIEQECIDNGIAIIKQVGGMVVINDGHLKVF